MSGLAERGQKDNMDTSEAGHDSFLVGLRRSFAGGPYQLNQWHLSGGASRLAALLLHQIRPVFSVVAPCHPGAALRNLLLIQLIRTTSPPRPRFGILL